MFYTPGVTPIRFQTPGVPPMRPLFGLLTCCLLLVLTAPNLSAQYIKLRTETTVETTKTPPATPVPTPAVRAAIREESDTPPPAASQLSTGRPSAPASAKPTGDRLYSLANATIRVSFPDGSYIPNIPLGKAIQYGFVNRLDSSAVNLYQITQAETDALFATYAPSLRNVTAEHPVALSMPVQAVPAPVPFVVSGPSLVMTTTATGAVRSSGLSSGYYQTVPTLTGVPIAGTPGGTDPACANGNCPAGVQAGFSLTGPYGGGFRSGFRVGGGG